MFVLNWQHWSLDLESKMAAPVEGSKDFVIGMHESFDTGHVMGSFVKEPRKDKSIFDTIDDPMTKHVWQQGRHHIQRAVSLYGNIDVLRPYFHVDPFEVKERLVESLIPRFFSKNKPVLVGELYGPLMVVFSLIALLLFGMKTSGHVVKEGTLMGTAFAVCFGYWIGGSMFVYSLAFVCNAQISYIQTLSLMGYSLFGHCVALFLGIVMHPEGSHAFFYTIWAVFGGLSALKMVSVLMTRTTGGAQRLVLNSVVGVIHMLFLLFLHFAYHKTVEALDHI